MIGSAIGSTIGTGVGKIVGAGIGSKQGASLGNRPTGVIGEARGEEARKLIKEMGEGSLEFSPLIKSFCVQKYKEVMNAMDYICFFDFLEGVLSGMEPFFKVYQISLIEKVLKKLEQEEDKTVLIVRRLI